MTVILNNTKEKNTLLDREVEQQTKHAALA
jgi:hypothetical protein